MLKFARRKHSIPLHAYSLLCAFLISGCAQTGGNYNLGQADAQISEIAKSYPELGDELQKIKNNLSDASKALTQKEETIDKLTKMLDLEQDKSKERLIWIWKLTSAVLLLLLVTGTYIAWKLK